MSKWNAATSYFEFEKYSVCDREISELYFALFKYIK